MMMVVYTMTLDLAVEDIPNIVDGRQRYDMFVKAYNETREHGGINGRDVPTKINYIHHKYKS
jgi:hypothetical protein